MPPVKRTLKPSGTGTVPSPNANTITFPTSGKRDNCSKSHITFLLVSFREAPPVVMTKASAAKLSCLRHACLSCGLKTVVSIPGGITRTPPHASAILLLPAISASQKLFATIRARQLQYARSFRENAAFASSRFAGHRRIGHELQGSVWLVYRLHPR